MERNLSKETALEMLTNQHRRAIVRYVDGADGATTVRVLGEVLSGRDGTELQNDGGQQKLHVQMRHVHLPKLDDAGVIEYDFEQGSVRRGRHFSSVAGLLDPIEAFQK